MNSPIRELDTIALHHSPNEKMITRLCKEFKEKNSLLILEWELAILRKEHDYVTAANHLEYALKDVQHKNGWPTSYRYIPQPEDWKVIDYSYAQKFGDAMIDILSREEIKSVFISVGKNNLSVVLKTTDGTTSNYSFLPTSL